MDNAETLDMILEKLKRLRDVNNEQLPSLEKYVQGEIDALLDTEAAVAELVQKIFKIAIPEEMPEAHDEVQFCGSMVEGAYMARCFQKNEEWNEIETNITCNCFTIPQEVSHLLEPVEGKRGYVRLPYQELCSAYPIIAMCVPNQTAKYISPLSVKEDLEQVNDIIDCISSTDSLSRGLINIKTSGSKTETAFKIMVDCNLKIN